MNFRKSIISIVSLFMGWIIQAQIEQYPIYPNCEQESIENRKTCFINSITKDFNDNFQRPSSIEFDSFSVVFSATKEGNFQVLYVKTDHPEIKQEVKRVFDLLPKFSPATYNNHPIGIQFVLPYPVSELNPNLNSEEILSKNSSTKNLNIELGNDKFHSTLRIPLSYRSYQSFSEFEFAENTHSAVKPYTYAAVSQYVNLDSIHQTLLKDKKSWWGRKFWNENMLSIQEGNFWFQLDPIIDLQMGKDNKQEDYTYNNTRGVKIEGSLINKISFSSTLLESQGRFADYFNSYALFKKPISEAYATIPSRDTSNEFKNNAFDYPMTTGYLSIAPFDFMNIQFGHDKNFIGEGYRSLFLSDVGAPYTFLKINTKFWKIQYTNLWTWLRDVDTETANDEPYKRKYMAMHYLSWNATKNLNIGLFESVTWAKTPERGFDVHYLNPVIFFKALEFSNGSRAGNTTIGLSANYRLFNTVQLYSQFLLDEMTMEFFLKGDGYWANKYGFQFGAKYYNAFKVQNLTLQAEYNQVQPFTYSHSKTELNYAHVNQPLAHLWESNFNEFTAIASFKKNRWFGKTKLIFGTKGFDVNSDTDSFSYGGNILRSTSDKNSIFGVKLGQGNKANILIGELQAGYVINPASNLKVFANVLYRDFSSELPNTIFENKTTTWFNLGLRTDINNWYFDF